ncbi:hypothetical protein B5F40_15015, partial [Gordonibacter sp. An230]
KPAIAESTAGQPAGGQGVALAEGAFLLRGALAPGRGTAGGERLFRAGGGLEGVAPYKRVVRLRFGRIAAVAGNMLCSWPL